MVPHSSRAIVLLFLSGLAFNLSSAPVLADDQAALDRMFNQPLFRDSFFSQQFRQDSNMDDLAEFERKRAEERAEKKDLRRKRDEIEEKDKLERAEKNKQMFDRSEESSSDSTTTTYTTPILDNDFTFNFEKQVLQPDLFSEVERPNFDYAKGGDPDLDGPDDYDWLQVTRSNSGLFPRAREIDDHKYDRDYDSPERRRQRAKLPGPIIEVTGDWVPDKLDPINNGGFTIAPDNGSPVPYKLNGHVDIQRGRPWNDND